MNSTLEKRNTQPTMEEMKVMQQTALSRSIDKAANIQKAVTLTEANWTGLIEALELTGRSALKLQDTMDRLITNEDLDMMLKAQVKSLMGQYQTAVYNIQTAAAELNKSCAAHLKRTEDAIGAIIAANKNKDIDRDWQHFRKRCYSRPVFFLHIKVIILSAKGAGSSDCSSDQIA